MDTRKTSSRELKSKMAARGMSRGLMVSSLAGTIPGEGRTTIEAVSFTAKMPGEDKVMAGSAPVSAKMPGEGGAMPPGVEEEAENGKMPGEGAGMPGAATQAEAPAERYSVFHKPGAVISAAALAGLGPYTKRGST